MFSFLSHCSLNVWIAVQGSQYDEATSVINLDVRESSPDEFFAIIIQRETTASFMKSEDLLKVFYPINLKICKLGINTVPEGHQEDSTDCHISLILLAKSSPKTISSGSKDVTMDSPSLTRSPFSVNLGVIKPVT